MIEVREYDSASFRSGEVKAAKQDKEQNKRRIQTDTTTIENL
jgi:hypothetical protein